MNKFLLITLLLALVLPFSVGYAYSVYDYDPDYTPYNLDGALMYNTCDDEVEDFDEKYQEYTKEYLSVLSGDGFMTQSSRDAKVAALQSVLESNRLSFQIEFSDCIELGQTRAELKEAEAAEKATKEHRQSEIQSALSSCNFSFFETMTTEEKMSTFEARQACEEARYQALLDEQEKAKEEIESFLEYTDISNSVEPGPATYTPPKPVLTPAPAREPTQTEEAETPVQTPESDETRIEVTEEGLERMVEERVAAVLEEVETEPGLLPEPERPSFIKRLVDFLFGWF